RALALLSPTSRAPIRPGPAVPATASTSSRRASASLSAASTTGLTSCTCWREATSGTTPPKWAWASACEEMTLERIRPPSVRAAQVSSQDVSSAKIMRGAWSLIGSGTKAGCHRLLQPHDQGVLAVVVVVAAADARGAKAELLVHLDRLSVGHPHLERERRAVAGQLEQVPDQPRRHWLPPP